MGNNKPSSLKFALITGTGAFFIAVFFSFFSAVVLPKLEFVILSFLFLLLVITTGIIFDIIGVASAVAEEKPFHAKAAKKIKGAGHAILITRNADKVATFCNDVVGDICGTVSGALGAAMVFQIVIERPGWNEAIFSVIMTGFVAALTVGGKAAGKRTALHDSQQIVFGVGRILAWFETITRLRILSGNNRRGRVKRR